ncbi:hypothetical protein RvY_16391-1 [Ramazzottius varieornatus]|uniref:Receptor ligand binding region domain-containing protein n=1 Tax=Ramazzottius varieornatus TaxID=947166 RepID=A0A1D1W131_RAMVA|nr:hypothetical protein RvY_16391-1 [Ramazzottius varieornatus]
MHEPGARSGRPFTSTGGDSKLTNRKRYPTMTITSPLAGADVLAAIPAFLQKFNWRTLSLMCDFMSQSPGLSNFYFTRCNEIRRYLIAHHYDHFYLQFDSTKERASTGYLEELRNRSRRHQPKFQIARRAYRSLIVLTGVSPTWKLIKNLTKSIARTATALYNFTYSPEDEVFAENYAVLLSGLATTSFMTKFANRTFSFAERNYTTDSTGSKINPVVVLRLDPMTEAMAQAMVFDHLSEEFQHIRNDLWYWVNRSSPPPDRPPCGYSNDQCETSGVGQGIVIGLLITFILLLLLAAGITLYL